MKRDISHLLNSIYENPVFSTILAALVVSMAVQVAPSPRLFGFDSQETYEEFEEEGADPAESDGEQSLPELAGLASCGPQRCESRCVQRLALSLRQRRTGARVNLSLPAELAHRNGAGGPLRC
jgi:hypothetical protein